MQSDLICIILKYIHLVQSSIRHLTSPGRSHTPAQVASQLDARQLALMFNAFVKVGSIGGCPIEMQRNKIDKDYMVENVFIYFHYTCMFLHKHICVKIWIAQNACYCVYCTDATDFGSEGSCF